MRNRPGWHTPPDPKSLGIMDHRASKTSIRSKASWLRVVREGQDSAPRQALEVKLSALLHARAADTRPSEASSRQCIGAERRSSSPCQHQALVPQTNPNHTSWVYRYLIPVPVYQTLHPNQATRAERPPFCLAGRAPGPRRVSLVAGCRRVLADRACCLPVCTGASPARFIIPRPRDRHTPSQST